MIKIMITGRWWDTVQELNKLGREKGVEIQIIKSRGDHWFDFQISGPEKKVRSFQASVLPEWQRVRS